ncbi:MAG: hypothetical protein ACTSRI_18485 [Promethearchaeota archaeon]
MEEFLRKVQFSNEAILIYLQCLGRSSLTYNELYSLVPNLPPEAFPKVITELINGGLLIQINPQKPEILLHFLAVPPIKNILSYFSNINNNLINITRQVQEIVINSLNQIFQENEKVVLNFYQTFQEKRKDIIEDIYIQKQEVEDNIKKQESLNKIKEVIYDLQNQIKSTIQTQFPGIIKNLTQTKKNIINKVKSLKQKKINEEIINIIEEAYKTEIENLIKNYTSMLYELIEEKFNSFKKPINNIINSNLQLRNDFKTLFLSVISNFEVNINKFQEIIKNQKDLPKDDVSNLKNRIAESFYSIIQNSLNQVSGLNKPIELIIQQYLQKISSNEKTEIKNIWLINSKSKMYEELQNILSNSKKNLSLIVPKFEGYLSIEQFQNLPKNLKIKIASSDPTTNSLIINAKKIININFKNIQNENMIALKGDNNHLVIGIIQKDSKEPLDNFIGFGSNSESIIKLLTPIIDTYWTPKIGGTLSPIKPTIATRPVSPVKPTPIKSFNQSTTQIPSIVPDQQFSTTTTPTKQITQDFQKQIDSVLAIQPKESNEANFLINNAFNALIEKLNVLKGNEFSIELNIIAELILNRKGFSVTLHKLRSSINEFKKKETLLDESDKNEIITSIREWKQKFI